MPLNDLIEVIFTAQQSLLIVLTDVTERYDFLCEYLVNFSYPNYNSKLGFIIQHYVLENFHAPFKFLPPWCRALIMTSP